MDIEQRVQELLDREEIRDVIYRYAEAIDRWDKDLMRQVFTPDARVRLGLYDGPALDMMPDERSKQQLSSQMLLGNIRIKLQGDRAKSVSCLSTVMISELDGTRYHNMFRSRYLDRLRRHEGQWRIAERRMILDWDYSVPVEQRPEGHKMENEAVLVGKDRQEDAAYAFFASDEF